MNALPTAFAKRLFGELAVCSIAMATLCFVTHAIWVMKQPIPPISLKFPSLSIATTYWVDAQQHAAPAAFIQAAFNTPGEVIVYVKGDVEVTQPIILHGTKSLIGVDGQATFHRANSFDGYILTISSDATGGLISNFCFCDEANHPDHAELGL